MAAALSVAVFSVTGCDSPAAPGTPSQEVAEAARVGAAGSGCELPVTFGLQASWRPEAVALDESDPPAGLARRGALTLVCEIDAKPAGPIGFLRVYTGKADDPRAVLTEFIGASAQDAVFTESRAGEMPALEVAYQSESEPERAFIVEAGSQLVAVALDSLDGDEHADMLPAFELAKTSLTATS